MLAKLFLESSVHSPFKNDNFMRLTEENCVMNCVCDQVIYNSHTICNVMSNCDAIPLSS